MADRVVRVRFEAITTGAQRAIAGMAQDTRRLGSETTQWVRTNEQSLTRAGLALTAFGAAATLAMRRARGEFSDFESETTKMTTLVGVARDEVEEMSASALRMADTGRGPQELARSLFFATSAGLDGANAMSVVEASARAASVGLGDTATIVDLTTSAVNAYGAEVLSAEQATDILIGAVREGKAEAPQLASAIGQVLPIASQMGVSFDEVGAAVAAMTRTGTEAGQATTNLRSILMSMLRPSQQAAETLEDYGLSAEQIRRTIEEEGLWAALTLLRDTFEGNDEALARVIPRVEGLAGFLDLMGANAADTEQIFARMTDTSGLGERAFREWGETSEASAARFTAAWEAAMIALGEGSAGVMDPLRDTATGLLQTFVDMPDPVRSAGSALLTVGGGASLVAGATLLLLPRLVATRDAMASLGVNAGSLARFMTGPWGLAIGAGALALRELGQRADRVSDAVSSLRLELDGVASSADTLSDAWIVNELRSRDLLETAARMGLSLADIRGVIVGNEDATAKFNDALTASWFTLDGLRSVVPGVRNEYGDMRAAVVELRDASSSYNAEIEAQAELTRQLVSGTGPALVHAFGDMGGSAGDFAEALVDAEESTGILSESLQGLSDALAADHTPVAFYSEVAA